MVTMSNVWDRTTEVLRGRAGLLASIAALTLFMPGVVRDGVTAFLTPGSTAFVAVGGLVSIVVAIIALWGQLALLAMSNDPTTTRSDAYAQASARLLPAIGVTIVAILVAMLFVLPVAVAIGLSGADFSTMTTTGAMPDIGGGTAAFIGLYALFLFAFGLFIIARIMLVNVVVLNERRGLGAFRRSFELTRGLTWRIIGVLILYVIVLAVAASAAQFITGAVFGLLLDDARTTTFLAAVVAGVVTTIFSVIAAVFTAQLYVAVAQRGVATVFE